jgi:hypothetical protein
MVNNKFERIWIEVFAVELKNIPLQLRGRNVENHEKPQQVLSLGA